MKRKPHTPDEKAKLVLEILRGERPLNETASENGVHPNMLSKWKRRLSQGFPPCLKTTQVKSAENRSSMKRNLVNFTLRPAGLSLKMSGSKKSGL